MVHRPSSRPLQPKSSEIQRLKGKSILIRDHTRSTADEQKIAVLVALSLVGGSGPWLPTTPGLVMIGAENGPGT